MDISFMEKKQKNVDYVLKLTETCKTWGGPCCSAEELKGVLKRNPDNEKKMVKTELSFYVHTHKADRLGRPELFKLANIDTATICSKTLSFYCQMKTTMLVEAVLLRSLYRQMTML